MNLFRVVVLDRPAADHPDWLTWARRLGVDPSLVPVPSLLVCDDLARQVTFVQSVLEESRWTRQVTTLQLEAPALAFPVGGYAWYLASTPPTPLDMILGSEGHASGHGIWHGPNAAMARIWHVGPSTRWECGSD